MRFQAGQKVRIVENPGFKPEANQDFDNLDPPRIITIDEVDEKVNYYWTSEFGKLWHFRDGDLESIDMRFKPGQVVKIREDLGMTQGADKFDPPFVGTITNIEPDPHTGLDMYGFEESTFGWYDREIEGLYEVPEVTSRFDLMDL